MCKEEEKDMAVVANNIACKLDELKLRAAKRKSSNQPSANYIKELEENAKQLYSEQFNTFRQD